MNDKEASAEFSPALYSLFGQLAVSLSTPAGSILHFLVPFERLCSSASIAWVDNQRASTLGTWSTGIKVLRLGSRESLSLKKVNVVRMEGGRKSKNLPPCLFQGDSGLLRRLEANS